MPKLYIVIPKRCLKVNHEKILFPHLCFEYMKPHVDLNFCFIFPVVLFTVSQNLFAGSAARSELAKSQVA